MNLEQCVKPLRKYIVFKKFVNCWKILLLSALPFIASIVSVFFKVPLWLTIVAIVGVVSIIILHLVGDLDFLRLEYQLRKCGLHIRQLFETAVMLEAKVKELNFGFVLDVKCPICGEKIVGKGYYNLS